MSEAGDAGLNKSMPSESFADTIGNKLTDQLDRRATLSSALTITVVPYSYTSNEQSSAICSLVIVRASSATTAGGRLSIYNCAHLCLLSSAVIKASMYHHCSSASPYIVRLICRSFNHRLIISCTLFVTGL